MAEVPNLKKASAKVSKAAVGTGAKKFASSDRPAKVAAKKIVVPSVKAVAPVKTIEPKLATPVKPTVALAAKPVLPPALKPVLAEAPVAAAAEPEKKAASSPQLVAKENSNMIDTITKTQETFSNAAEQASAFFGDVNGRTKVAVEKGTKAVEEFVEFSKGNLEAIVASGRVAAKGAEEIAKYSAEYGRASIEKANATAKQFATVKSPTEFFQLQGDLAKQTLDSFVAESSKFTDSYLKLIGEITQPLSNRAAIAAERIKSVVAA